MIQTQGKQAVRLLRIEMQPINKQAAMMLNAGKIESYYSKTQPALRPIPAHLAYRIGTKVGKFTLVGLHDSVRKNGRYPYWAVKCDCGFYCIRSIRDIKQMHKMACYTCLDTM